VNGRSRPSRVRRTRKTRKRIPVSRMPVHKNLRGREKEASQDAAHPKKNPMRGRKEYAGRKNWQPPGPGKEEKDSREGKTRGAL